MFFFHTYSFQPFLLLMEKIYPFNNLLVSSISSII